MFSGNAGIALPHLNYCITIMESVINLSTLRYLEWRVELYTAVCCSYAYLGHWDQVI